MKAVLDQTVVCDPGQLSSGEPGLDSVEDSLAPLKVGLQELYGADEGRSLGGTHEGRQNGYALLTGLADPPLGVNQSWHNCGGNVLQVELVTRKGQKGEHYHV